MSPRGIAVDNASPLEAPSAGDLYIGDRGNSRIDKFASDGEFLLAWGAGVADGKGEVETCGPAATPATTKCQPGIAGGASGEFEGVAGVAVDSSTSLSRGSVYVEDSGNNRIDKFDESGNFLLAWGAGVADGKAEPETCGPDAVPAITCEAGVEGEGPGEFAALERNSISVDALGVVCVANNGKVQKFSAAGKLEAVVTLAGAGKEINALAVDSVDDFYVMSSEFGSPVPSVRKYDASGAEVGSRDPAAESSSVIALGPADELFVKDESGQIAEFEAGGNERAVIPNGESAAGLAFGKLSGELYVLTGRGVRVVDLPPPGPLIEAEKATMEPVGAATVGASINPEGRQTSYRLEYGLDAAKETATELITMPAEGFESEEVSVHLSGLLPNATYHFHFVVENSAGTPPSPADETFTTLPAVSIDSESVSQVTSTSARLATTLNPLSLPSEYRFEYGPTTAYGASAPIRDGDAGSGVGDASFSVLVEGLTPGTQYHYRVVAHNTFGEVKAADRSFTTQVGDSRGLIDGRAWELVSPPDKHGAALEAITSEGSVIQASEDGSALAYIAKAPVDTEPAGNRSFAEQQLLARRELGGWSTQDIATTHEAVAGLGRDGFSEYRLFSSDLSAGVVEPTGATPLSPQASERTPYRRELSGEYLPLVNPGNVPSGTKFGADEGGGLLKPGTGVQFTAATPDLSHIVLSAPQSLAAGFETEGQQALYEWGGGKLQPASILPGGGSAAGEGGVLETVEGAQMTRNAVSADGERLSFGSRSGSLFTRNMVRGESVRLDEPEPGARGPRGGRLEVAAYQDASNSGTQVFFQDAARLTANATANEGEPDLYMCAVGGSVDEGSCAAKKDLRDLTLASLPGEAADVLGAVIGASEDGAYVYFVANGVLSNNGIPVAGATHGECAEPSGQLPSASALCNLYLWHNGAISLVGVLSNRDFPDWEAGPAPHTNLSALTARVSPNGRFLAFMSQQSLTGFDNTDAISGIPDEEVFLYDSATGRTACASCGPSNERPSGVLDPELESGTSLLVDRPRLWSGQWLAASIPGWTSAQPDVAWYQSRYLSDEGRLFFNSAIPLVPKDANGQQDVYEFEPQGHGGCTPATASGDVAFVAGTGGCVGLISSGSSNEEAAFLDASAKGPGGAEGEDVFFLTAAKLATHDGDKALDVYDAHVCSVAVPCASTAATTPPPCTTTASCEAGQGSQSEILAAPATTMMPGAGNLLPPRPRTAAQVKAEKLAKALKSCRRYRTKTKRAKCIGTARRRYGVKRKAKGTARKGAK